jgi:hypothetical protein
MSDEDLPPTHRPWGATPDPDPAPQPQPPPPPSEQTQPGAPYAPPPNPYPHPGSFDQYAAPNPYGASPYGVGGPGALAPEHPSTTTGLVLGIIGLVGIFTCAGVTLVLSPIAWVISGRALREIDAAPGRYSGREKVNAGRIMGIIGTALLALGLLAITALIVLAVAISPSGGNVGPHPPQVHHHGVSS